jgi:hypothetical protein
MGAAKNCFNGADIFQVGEPENFPTNLGLIHLKLTLLTDLEYSITK